MAVSIKDRLFAEGVCKRASRLGWKVMEEREQGYHVFAFGQQSTLRTATGKARKDRQEALVSACQKLAPLLA